MMNRENLRQIPVWEKIRVSVFQRPHRGRDEIGVSALSAGAYTATLYVRVGKYVE
jgi:hypothetical protein